MTTHSTAATCTAPARTTPVGTAAARTAPAGPGGTAPRPARRRLAPAATLLAAAALAGGVLAAPAASAATAPAATAPAAAVVHAAPAAAGAAVATTLPGQDVSWPQCPKSYPGKGYGLPMPSAASRFVVLGLTAGSGFSRNPCLGMQVAWTRARHLLGSAYTVPSYPTAAELAAYGAAGPYGTRTLTARLQNVGFAQARAAARTMAAYGVRSPRIWIDVEPNGGRPWSANRAANVAVLRGVIAGVRATGHRAGIYSNRSGWAAITGNTRFGVPEWRTVGGTGRAAALRTCSAASLQGGPVSLVQYWTATSDYDVACPRVAGVPSRMKIYFSRY